MTRLEIAKQHTERLYGRKTADRVEMFKNGILYVRPGGWAQFFTWLIDFVVYVVTVAVGIVVVALVGSSAGLTNGVLALLMIAVLFGAPVLYGLFYGNGRALGALFTGTQLVRVKDGGRVGFAACWAMLIRTVLMPGLFLVLMFGALEGGGFVSPGGSLVRTSIDRAATRQLHAAGIR
ncbi:hypothetical protein ACWDV4_21670 [Micromonospora sp. NPDC003197]